MLINTNKFLFAFYIAKVLIFLVIFGEIAGDMGGFASTVGLSIALNGGIRKPMTGLSHVPAKKSLPFHGTLQPSFQRR